MSVEQSSLSGSSSEALLCFSYVNFWIGKLTINC